MKKKKDYQVRYGPPWRHGERSRRYYVFEPPRYVRRLWRFYDPIDRTYQRWMLHCRYTVGLIAGLIEFVLEVVGRIAAIGFLGYVYLKLCLPYILEHWF